MSLNISRNFNTSENMPSSLSQGVEEQWIAPADCFDKLENSPEWEKMYPLRWKLAESISRASHKLTKVTLESLLIPLRLSISYLQLDRSNILTSDLKKEIEIYVTKKLTRRIHYVCAVKVFQLFLSDISEENARRMTEDACKKGKILDIKERNRLQQQLVCSIKIKPFLILNCEDLVQKAAHHKIKKTLKLLHTSLKNTNTAKTTALSLAVEESKIPQENQIKSYILPFKITIEKPLE